MLFNRWRCNYAQNRYSNWEGIGTNSCLWPPTITGKWIQAVKRGVWKITIFSTEISGNSSVPCRLSFFHVTVMMLAEPFKNIFIWGRPEPFNNWTRELVTGSTGQKGISIDPCEWAMILANHDRWNRQRVIRNPHMECPLQSPFPLSELWFAGPSLAWWARLLSAHTPNSRHKY